MVSAIKKRLVCALLVTVGLLLGYLESVLFPVIPLYGLKIGFSNLPVLFALYYFNSKCAYAVGITKAVLNGLLFAGGMSILYSATGIVLSVFVMSALKKINNLSVYGVSVAGSALFQVGQIIVACMVLQSYAPLYYLSYLLFGSVICGLICGGVVWIVLRHFKEFIYEKKDGC